jgi:lipoate-protein ligase A
MRIIRDDARSAAFNMKADCHLLERAPEQNTVYLRLYSWSPPAVSLGYMQSPDSILDNKVIVKKGVEWAVRPTGGRAVLHWNDLTYALVFPADLREMGRTISESYSVISGCLVRGLALAGIPSETRDSSIEYSATARNLRLPCFLSPNRSEIMVQGKKLVGSAQKRTPQAVLQHGSIPLDGSFRRLPEFLAISSEERARHRALLEKKCICVNEIDPAIDFDRMASCLINGFKETLPFQAVEKPWGKEEIEEIKKRI